MEAQPEPGTPRSASPRPLPGRVVSCLAVTVLGLLAGSGAASHPDGVLIGVPTSAVVVLALLAGWLVFVSGIAGLGWLLLPAGGLFLGALGGHAFAPLLLFSGPPLASLVLAALVLAAAAKGALPPRALLLAVVFPVYAFVSYEVQTRVGPDGDEPQYLMVTESLVRDHDLALDRDFEEARYAPFFSRPLKPDFRIRGLKGEIYSLHAVGLSILILPAYVLGGYAGASFFMALVAALLVLELRRLATELTGSRAVAEGTAWLVAFSPPIIHFAGLIFTEIPAALLLAVGLRTAVFGRTSRALLAAASCAAALPWLNVRYAILSLAIAAAMGLRGFSDRRKEAGSGRALSRFPGPLVIVIGSALALGFYHFELWGFWDPRRVYGRRPEFSLSIFPEGLPGLFLDQEFGLFVYAPLFVLALAGFVPLWRRHRSFALAGLLAVVGVIATASVWPMWRGGFNPPARFLVPLAPILSAGLALSLRRGIRPATALLAGWSLWCGLGGAFHIETIHRDRDGVAPFFRTESGAREWTGALPSFVLPEDRPTRVLALPWAMLLGLPLLGAALRPEPRRGPIRNRDVLLAVSAFMLTAWTADRLSPRVRAPERDAARLQGAPSLLVPSLRLLPSTGAVWAIDLFHEPHRFPEGLGFATAVPLGALDYELVLTTANGPEASAPPTLVLRQRRSGRTQARAMRVGSGELTVRFSIEEAGAYDLSLRGGDPVVLTRVRISVVR